MKSQAVTIIERCINFMAFTAKHNICFVIHSNDCSVFLGRLLSGRAGTQCPAFTSGTSLPRRRQAPQHNFDASLFSRVIKSKAVTDGDNAAGFMTNQTLAAAVFLR